MNADVLDRRALNRATLARQLLLERADLPVVDVVDHLVGMQAQVPLNPYLALWSRLTAFDPAELSDRLQRASDAVEEFPHGFTASGHPVGCAIALKAIDVVMNEGLSDNVRRLTPSFEAGMARLAQHPNIGEWRGVGLMGALEAVQDKATKSPFPGHLSVSERVANACTDQGLICRPLGQAIVLAPPFIFTDAHMDEMFGKLGRALDRVFAEVA